MARAVPSQRHRGCGEICTPRARCVHRPFRTIRIISRSTLLQCHRHACRDLLRTRHHADPDRGLPRALDLRQSRTAPSAPSPNSSASPSTIPPARPSPSRKSRSTPWRLRVDFNKLDVQGKELEALEGAQQTIARCHPIFLLEFRARPAASACASSSTRAAKRRSRPATTSSPCTRATRSSSSCSFPTCRRNQRPERLTPSPREPRAASAHTRRRREPP